jgi:hypothetical protein
MTPAERSLAIVILATTGVLALHGPGRAQSAEAEVLFREGRKQIKAGNLNAGCDKLAASERLETSVGTLLNLGDCREKLGKLASAWAAFRKAEAIATRAGDDGKRRAEARRRAARLEPNLANLVIQVDRRIDGMVVRRDGMVVDAAAWNTAVPVDPGNYAIVVEAPGRVAWRTTVPIAARTRRQVVAVPELERAPLAEPAPAVALSPTGDPGASVTTVPVGIESHRRSRTWSTARKVSVGLGVAGLGAVGAGVYFGVQARDLQSRADDRCPLAVCADPEALRLNDEAQRSAMRANIFYIAGGAAVAAAAVIWIVGKPGDETIVTPTVGDREVGLSVAGRF